MNLPIKNILEQLKQQLQKLYGDRLINLTLFGSQARGDQQPDSDIDVLIILRSSVNPGEEIKRTGEIVADLSLNYDTVISCLFMNETDYKTQDNALLRNIHAEGITL